MINQGVRLGPDIMNSPIYVTCVPRSNAYSTFCRDCETSKKKKVSCVALYALDSIDILATQGLP